MTDKMRFYFVLLLSLLYIKLSAQIIPQNRVVDWTSAGNHFNFSTITDSIAVTSFGAVGDGITDNYNAFDSAISSLNGKPGIIFIPTGTYLFNHALNLPDSVILKGTGAETTILKFNVGEYSSSINISGSASGSFISILNGYNKNSKHIMLSDSLIFSAGDMAEIMENGAPFMTSSWAMDCLGQIVKIDSVNGHNLYLSTALRMNYVDTLNPRIRKINPINAVGIQCLKIERLDSTGSQTSNIYFNYARNCEVFGVESFMCNFSQLEINKSTNITIRNSYFHHAFSYGDGGKGYGVCIQTTSGECLVENNIFVHLRHAMFLQSGANGNVFAYNYSKEPYWTDVSLPSNSSGDMVLHGNYPYANLFEGNIGQNIVIDNSHGKNGPLNTFFRNRAELYGIFMNTSPATDSVNFVGNEVTNTTFLMGLYSLQGVGHFQYGNNIGGMITPSGTSNLSDTSYFFQSQPQFWNISQSFPPIGPPNSYNLKINPAKSRYLSGIAMATCSDSATNTSVNSELLKPKKTFEIISYSFNSIKNGFDVTINFSNTNKVDFLLYNTLGIILAHQEYYPISGLNEIFIPLKNKISGAMIFVTAIQSSTSKTLKFINL